MFSITMSCTERDVFLPVKRVLSSSPLEYFKILDSNLAQRKPNAQQREMCPDSKEGVMYIPSRTGSLFDGSRRNCEVLLKTVKIVY